MKPLLIFILLLISGCVFSQTAQPPQRIGYAVTRSVITTTTPLQFQSFMVNEGDSLGFFVYDAGTTSGAGPNVILGPEGEKFIRKKLAGAVNLATSDYYNKSEIGALLSDRLIKSPAMTSNYIPFYLGTGLGGLQNSTIYNSAGSIGIGTTAPLAILHVNGSARVDGTFRVTGNVEQDGIYDMGRTNFNGKLTIYGQNTTTPSSGTSLNGILALRGQFDNTSLNIGINTSQAVWLQAADRSALGTGRNLLLNPVAGNVGIRKTPSFPLDVGGVINTSSTYNLGGVSFAGSDENYNILYNKAGVATQKLEATQNLHISGSHVFYDFSMNGLGFINSSGFYSSNTVTSNKTVTGVHVGLNLVNLGTNATINRGTKIEFRSKDGFNPFGQELANIQALTATASDNNGKLTFATSNGGVLADRMIIDYNGGVGIGTSTPGAQLELGSFAGAYAFRIKRDASNIFDIYQGGGLTVMDVNVANGQLAFFTNATERMRIASSGNILVGSSTDNGLAKLQTSNLSLGTNTWGVVSADGVNRLYFGTNGDSYYRVPTGYRHYLRYGNLDSYMFTADSYIQYSDNLSDFTQQKSSVALGPTSRSWNHRKEASGTDYRFFDWNGTNARDWWNVSATSELFTLSQILYAKYGVNVGIGTASPSAGAILDLTSTTKAFLPPRMTGTQANAIATKVEGAMVYVTDATGGFASKGWYGWDGSNWSKLNP